MHARDVVLGLDHEPLSSDPRWPQDHNALVVGQALLRPLVLPGAAPGTSRPGAATTAEAADDATRWLLDVDPRLMWSDGTPLHADDVARAVLDVAARHRAASALAEPPVRVVSRHRVEVRFARPVGYALQLFTMPQFAPVRPGALLGPYVPLAGEPHRLQAAPRTCPHPDAPAGLELRAGLHAAAAVGAFEAGELDVTPTTVLGPDDLAGLAASPDLRLDPLLLFGHLEFGRRAPPFARTAACRRSLSGLLDRTRLAGTTGGLTRPLGSMLQAWGAAPPTPDADPAELPGGRDEVTIGYADYEPNGRVVGELSTQLATLVGAPVRPVPLTFREYVRAATSREHCLLYTLTAADFDSPAAALVPWRTGGSLAAPLGLSDPHLDRLIGAGERAADAGPDAWAAADEHLRTIAPRVPLLRTVSAYLCSPRLGGWRPDARGLVRFEELRIDG